MKAEMAGHEGGSGSLPGELMAAPRRGPPAAAIGKDAIAA